MKGVEKMIFSGVNEKGENLFDLVLAGKKTVTRRKHPAIVGAVLSVQRGRGKKREGIIKVISCQKNESWFEKRRVFCRKNAATFALINERLVIEAKQEANREGFESWDGLWNWGNDYYGNKLPEFYRIEFELITSELEKK